MNRFERAAQWVLYALAALIPLWFIPLPLNIEFGREASFALLILLAGILWLLSVLTAGEVRIAKSPILYAGAVLFVVAGLATFFSKAPIVSALYADPTAERLLALVMGFALMMIVAGVLRTQAAVGMGLVVLILASGLSGLVTLIQLLFNTPIWGKIFSFAQSIEFNVVGTINGYAMYELILFVIGLGLLFSRATERWQSWMRWLLAASTGIFAANLILINFRMSWAGLLVAAVIMFGMMFKDRALARFQHGGRDMGEMPKKFAFDWRYSLTILLIVFSVLLLMLKGTPVPPQPGVTISPYVPLVRNLSIAPEASPTYGATWDVAKKVMSESNKSSLLGVGPGLFGLAWGTHKDPSINQGLLWGVRFNQGASLLATIPATMGLLGILAFLLFLGVVTFVVLKGVLSADSENQPLAPGLFYGLIAALVVLAAYPANLTLFLLFFLVVGFLSSVLAEQTSPRAVFARETMMTDDRDGLVTIESETAVMDESSDEAGSFWNLREYLVQFASPWVTFLSSLVVIFLLALSVSGLYVTLGRIRAAVAQRTAADQVSSGDLAGAIATLEGAVANDAGDFRNLQSLTQVRVAQVQNIIQRAAAGAQVQDEFRVAVAAADRDARRLVEQYPLEPFLWRTQGTLYEILIPYVDGSANLAFGSYRRAAELDPLNPTAWVNLGRAYLVFSDQVALIANQQQGTERDRLGQIRVEALSEAQKAFTKAAEVKPDFAQSHFLLSQVAIRLGNIQVAIQATENAKLTAPFDIGIAFQLGLLYYQAGDLDRAQIEFERAVSLDANYSNARYFLGLIYDRKNEKPRAIGEFERISALNPDNQEVKVILENLRAGRGALESIVPPAAPPERRSEPPVRQQGDQSPAAPVIQRPQSQTSPAQPRPGTAPRPAPAPAGPQP